jgi:DNA-cytosine methyltransferase
MELFAGAGGMGLGFVLASQIGHPSYRLVLSAEIDPIYAHSLRRNHQYLSVRGLVNENRVPLNVEPLDLCRNDVAARIAAKTKEVGGIDVLIGGPPCQGFSSANRNTWSSQNPNNRLVDTFIDYVALLKPQVLLLENVQGIIWTPSAHSDVKTLSVADHIAVRLRRLGYLIFPKVLDAAWYGIPQHRHRFFLLGSKRDLGYMQDDFGEWGPYPLPTHGPGTRSRYVTVRDAIGDLPRIGNGAGKDELGYREPVRSGNLFREFVRRGAPRGVIWDHVTSRHSSYVVERYRLIPQGGNWKTIRHHLRNYADVDRTHSNIYKRLLWDEPSITIGHFRKSMVVHPSQVRGLSLREAARLQGFPDWFRFAGRPDGLQGGLMHKQQQIANAVCPLVTKTVAEFILTL